MGFILCEHCGTVIKTAPEGEGDVREGFCNWCETYLECENDGASHGSSEYDDYSWTDDYYAEVSEND